MSYSIESFWRQRLAAVQAPGETLKSNGWAVIKQGDESYVQADLSLRPDSTDLSQPVWLIAAPGAVGKTTLAKAICAASNAVYVDLAQATAVGGSYVVGGLVQNGLLSQWEAGQTTLVIDALDEARLRVTQAAFEDFLADVASVAQKGSLPLVLIGRVGIVEECWAILNDKAGLDCPIFDIELFDAERAIAFVVASLTKLAKKEYPDLKQPLETHPSKYRQAVETLVERLTIASSQDGNRFVGYAPVLEAVAKVIAGETNPSQVGPATLRILEGKILERLVSEILQRESTKLVNQMRASVPGFPVDATVYGETEQLVRLSSRVLGVATPAIRMDLPQHAIGPYEHAVATFLEQHPFLDGSGRAPSGAVFSACIVAHALLHSNTDLRSAAEAYARKDHHAPNPFLFDFYRGSPQVGEKLPAAHIGLLFESVQAKSQSGEVARLSVEGDADEELVDVEITVGSGPQDSRVFEMFAENGGTLQFGRRVAGVSVDAGGMDIEMGEGGQLELVAPLALNVRTLLLHCSELVVKLEASKHPTGAGSSDQADTAAVLEAQQFESAESTPLVTVRHGAELQVTWPGSKAYPWTNFSSESGPAEDPATADALRALRRLVMSFRSHSKGQLARFRGKIEHARMTKGVLGESVRHKLMGDEVLTIEGAMYVLDPKRLGDRVGVSFLDIKLKRYGPAVRAYVQGV
ncbi:hypothetical protein PMI12_01724 [Variovorax sp. CF313]|uniref:hypothetical protein n=1 Tax=Variovorax sp. CF313 TaxID=1144315 RepID=UPI000270EB96|nr:hypothetical protein [Variovorax sp. CF313]EJL77461.1 hypothetical protein PMI12_01724 [Variovorax sp. CF313]